MNCPKCGHEANGKFCGKCGTPISQQPDPGVLRIQEKCPQCGGWITPGKKFCGGCGHRVAAAESDAASSAKLIDPISLGVAGAAIGAAVTAVASAVVNRNKDKENTELRAEERGITELDKCCIKLELSAGMIARRVSEKEMETYAKREGVIVSPGTMLIVIADGRIVSKLSGGRYALPMDQGKHVSGLIKASTGNFVDKVINWFRRKDNVTEEQAISHQEAETIRKSKHVSLVLVREGDFVLPFVYKGLPFAEGITSDVALTFLMKVGDAEALFKHAMVDRVMEQTLIEILEPRLMAQLNRTLPSYRKENFVPGPELLDGLAPVLREAMAERYPGITIVDLIEATTHGGKLDEIRKIAGEMYDARLSIEQNEALMALNNIARSQENRKRLDDAKDQSEMAAAIRAINDEARQSGLASDEAMRIFEKEMLERINIFDRDQDERKLDRTQDSEIKRRNRSQVIDLLEIDQVVERDRAGIRGQMLREQAYHEHDRQKLDQELELRRKRLEELALGKDESLGQIEIDKINAQGGVDTSRITDDYLDTRREKDLDHVIRAKREKAKADQDELTAMADLAERGAAAKHARELEAERLRNEAELAKKRQEDEGKVKEMSAAAGLTFEQIMAMKQELSGDAGARALEAKYAADAKKTEAQAGADHAREMAARERELADRERRLNEERMADERARMDSMMDRMQQMAEGSMKNTANIASGQNAAHQKELERADKRADERGTEIVKSVEKTLQSTAQVFSADARAKGPQEKIAWTCKCGAGNTKQSTFCGECGEKKGNSSDSDENQTEGNEGKSTE